MLLHLCISICLAGVLLLPASGYSAERVSVLDSVTAAFAYNPELKSSQESRLSSQHAVEKAKTGYAPKIFVYGTAGVGRLSDSNTRAHNEQDEMRGFYNSGIRLTQPIWYGGETTANVVGREAQLQSADSMLEDKGSSLAFNAIVAHIEVLRRRELVTLAKQNVSEHAKILSTVRTRYNTQIATVGELNQVQSRYSRAKATLSSYESVLDAANASYLRVTGHQPKDLVPAHAPEVNYKNIDSVREACLAGNPRIKSAMSEVDASIGDRDLAESRFYPRFDAEFGPSWSDRDSRGETRVDNVEAALRMRWDIFSGGEDQASVRIANAKIRQNRQTLHSLMDILNEDIESTFSRWLSSVVQADEYDAAKKASRLARDDYYRQFLSAQRSLIDVLDAENDFFYSASQEVLSKGDRVIATYRLLTLSGELLSKLNVTVADLRSTGPTTDESNTNLRSAFDTPLFTKSSSTR